MLGELARGHWAFSEELEHLSARWIGECFENGVHVRLLAKYLNEFHPFRLELWKLLESSGLEVFTGAFWSYGRGVKISHIVSETPLVSVTEMSMLGLDDR